MGCGASRPKTSGSPVTASRSVPASHVPRRDRTPLMSAAQRQAVVAIYETQFGAVRRIMSTLTKAKVALRRRLAEARDRMEDQQQQQQTQPPPHSAGAESPTLPSISFPVAPQQQDSSSNHSNHDEHDQQRKRSSLIEAGTVLLQQRLSHLGLRQEVMGDDGNCQFRALAHQLFGSQDHHAHVRAEVCQFLVAHRATLFEFLFESPAAFDSYVAQMRCLRVWGDELTLRAASDAFNCAIHVLTSTEANCYLKYTPMLSLNGGTEGGAAAATAKECGGGGGGGGVGTDTECADGHTEVLDVFVSYIAPIHYNSVVIPRESPAATAGGVRGTVQRQ